VTNAIKGVEKEGEGDGKLSHVDNGKAQLHRSQLVEVVWVGAVQHPRSNAEDGEHAGEGNPRAAMRDGEHGGELRLVDGEVGREGALQAQVLGLEVLPCPGRCGGSGDGRSRHASQAVNRSSVVLHQEKTANSHE